MLTHYVKVVIGKKTIYLENAKYSNAKGITFLSGYQVDKYCEGVSKKGDVMHMISVGTKSTGPMPLFTPFASVKVYACKVNRTYCEIETDGRIQ